MKKQPQVTDQTKSNLQAAFLTLYKIKPIEKISIREITDSAGYNRGTFYLYYKDVYDLLAQIENELLGTLQNVIQDSLSQTGAFRFSWQMEIFAELMRTHSEYATVLLSDHGDPGFATRLKEIIWPLLNRYFVPSEGHSEFQMELLAEFYLSGILAAVTKWISDPQMTLDQFLDFMIPNIFPTESGTEEV